MHRFPNFNYGTSPEPVSVLVVEDEYLLALDLEQALAHAGFVTDIVSSGEQALTLFIGGAITYTALVTDVRLRGSVSGWELARLIRERKPALPVVYATGSPVEEWASHGVPNSILIAKPFSAPRLVTAIANLLDIGTPTTAQVDR